MKRVFVAGSRRLVRIPDDVTPRLDEMIRRQLTILVGDANGTDKAIQTYLAEKKYEDVTVYATAGECRNNLGAWPVRAVPEPHSTRDFAYFAAKDAAMAYDADVALMLWNGESAGTIVNVARLVSRGKPTVIYAAPARAFTTLKSSEELMGFLSAVDPIVRAKLTGYIHEHVTEFTQPQLL